MHIVYIHGFNSTAQSFKAQLLKNHLQSTEHTLFLPDLPHEPAAARRLLVDYAGDLNHRPIGFVGSSLGGYYATWLAETFQAPAVVINPAIRPYELLRAGLGENRNFHTGEIYHLTENHLDQLRDLEIEQPLSYPERFLLLTMTGDEVLDYRDGVARYAGAEQVVIEGGDHGFSTYAEYLQQTVTFLETHQEP